MLAFGRDKLSVLYSLCVVSSSRHASGARCAERAANEKSL